MILQSLVTIFPLSHCLGKPHYTKSNVAADYVYWQQLCVEKYGLDHFQLGIASAADLKNQEVECLQLFLFCSEQPLRAVVENSSSKTNPLRKSHI